MFIKGPVRELIPVAEQQVRLLLPEGTRAKKVQLLAAGKKPQFEQNGRELRMAVPSILDHEVVAVDV
jgi:hypothetical protein